MLKILFLVEKKIIQKIKSKISDLAALFNEWETQCIPFFNNCVIFFSNKKLHCNRTGQQFFNAPCKRMTFSLQKRKHHKKRRKTRVRIPG